MVRRSCVILCCRVRNFPNLAKPRLFWIVNRPLFVFQTLGLLSPLILKGDLDILGD